MALSTGIVPGYVNILVRSTQRVATSYIVTGKELSQNLLSFYKDVVRQLELLNPDIVHIHACWDFRASVFHQIARNKGYFTIVSPHGGLSPDQMEVNFWKDRFPKIIFYQLRMIKRCNSLILTTEKEMSDMKALKWKANLSLIPHPLTNNLSDDEISSLVMDAYRKVIDTNYQKRLTVEEEVLLNNCLRASAWKNKLLPDDFISELDTSGISFRRLFIYAYDQDVTDEFIEGAHILDVNIPPKPDVRAIPRFKIKEKVNKKKVRSLRTLIQILSNLTENGSEYDVKKWNLKSLLHAYSMLRFTDYDEDRFVKQITKNRIKNFTRKFMTLMSEQFQLEKGFMPILPK